MQTEVLVSIIGAASALAGAIVGGVATNWAQASQRRAEFRTRRRGLAAAHAAEIRAYLEMIEMRRYVQHAEQLHMALSQGYSVSLKGFMTEHERLTDPFPVYRSNIAEIGVLGPQLCGDLAIFHSWVSAVRSTIVRAEEGYYDTYAPEQSAELLREELAVWRDLTIRGRKLIEELGTVAREH